MTQEQFSQEKFFLIGLRFLQSLLNHEIMTKAEFDQAIVNLKEKTSAPVGTFLINNAQYDLTFPQDRVSDTNGDNCFHPAMTGGNAHD